MGVATVRHFRHMPTRNFFPKILLLMKNDKQRITYFNYVCLRFIVLMTSFHKLKDKLAMSTVTLTNSLELTVHFIFKGFVLT